MGASEWVCVGYRKGCVMSWEFFNSRQVKGRKDHRCEECHCDLPKGTLHQYCSGKFECELTDYRLCLECEVITSAYNIAYDPDDGFPLGETRSELRSDGVTDPLDWAKGIHAADQARRGLVSTPNTTEA